jgi:hypothetical protein
LVPPWIIYLPENEEIMPYKGLNNGILIYNNKRLTELLTETIASIPRRKLMQSLCTQANVIDKSLFVVTVHA